MQRGVGGCLCYQEGIWNFAHGGSEWLNRTSVLQITLVFIAPCVSDEQCFAKESSINSCLWWQLGCCPQNNNRVSPKFVWQVNLQRKPIRVS